MFEVSMAHNKPNSIENQRCLWGAGWNNWGSLLFLRVAPADQSLWEELLGHGIVTILTNIINLENSFNLKNHGQGCSSKG